MVVALNKMDSKSSLADMQVYIKYTLAARGFADETVAQKFMLFFEECGEFAQAARKHAGIKSSADKQFADLEDEAADVLILFLDICNKLKIDAAKAFRQKEAKNAKRVWQ